MRRAALVTAKHKKETIIVEKYLLELRVMSEKWRKTKIPCNYVFPVSAVGFSKAVSVEQRHNGRRKYSHSICPLLTTTCESGQSQVAEQQSI